MQEENLSYMYNLEKAVYGMMKSASSFYQKRVADLTSLGVLPSILTTHVNWQFFGMLMIC